LTRTYTPSHWFAELQGIADGAGLPYSVIVQVHMIPELIQVKLVDFFLCLDFLIDFISELLPFLTFFHLIFDFLFRILFSDFFFFVLR